MTDNTLSSDDPAGALLGKDYWLVLSSPALGVDAEAMADVVEEHVDWLLGLERRGWVLCSGPLLSGPGIGPGSGVTVLRAPDEETAVAWASADPFVQHGLRTFTVHRWRLNEGSVAVRISLGTGTYDWE